MKILTFCILLCSLSIFSAPLANAQSSSVVLHIHSSGTNIAVDSAEVAIMQSHIKTLSDESGRATLSRLQSGLYLMSIKHPQYVNQTLSINIRRGQTVEKNILMIPQLDEVLVSAKRVHRFLEEQGFYRRQKKGLGIFLSTEDIEKKGNLRPSALFYGIAGIRVQISGGEARVVSNRLQSVDQVSGAVPCALEIFLDDTSINGTIDSILSSIKHIAAVEIYKGPATIPPKYSNYNSCGAILIWTK